MNQPQELVPFTYITPDNNKELLNVFMEDDGSVWFVAKDVANILGFRDAEHATRGLDEDEKDTQKMGTLGGMQSMTVISESGLYTLIFRSNKPEAKRFRKWVTSEVLPEIRKTGKYEMTQPVDLFGFLGSLQAEDKKSEEKEPLYAMMNLDRCPAGTGKQYKMYRVKTAIATIEAPATATGRKFILEMLEELNIK